MKFTKILGVSSRYQPPTNIMLSMVAIMTCFFSGSTALARQ